MMKNLANCNVREFLVQTNRIRKYVADWLSLTQIMEIRKQTPELAEGMTREEKDKAIREQVRKNADDILDAVLDKHPEETAVLLGLMCFIEPKDLDQYSMASLFGAYSEMIECEEIVSFFTSLMRLVSRNTSSTPKA